jgi:hypothetical protein
MTAGTYRGTREPFNAALFYKALDHEFVEYACFSIVQCLAGGEGQHGICPAQSG